MTHSRSLCLASFALAACAVDPGATDDADDVALADGKADGVMSACEEAELLAYLNSGVSAEALEDAGVHTKAANNLAAWRHGSDGIEGTDDDRGFETLAQVDAVPYVGPVAFAQLQAIVAPRCELVTLTGTCTTTTTTFVNNLGTPRSETSPVTLPIRITSTLPAAPAEPAPVTGQVLVASPWGDLPPDIWRAWCNRRMGNFEDLTTPCAIGGFEVPTAYLGFGSGGYSHFTYDGAAFALRFSGVLEFGRSGYHDSSWTQQRFSCTLR